MNTSINNSIENLWNSYNEINNDINFSFGTPFRPLNYRCNEMIIMCEIVEKMQEFYDELYANEEYDVLFDEANKVYVELIAAKGTACYYIYSDKIDKPAPTDKVQIWLRRISNLYVIGVYNLGTGGA